MTSTRIEWATDVWNPISGCDRVSDGCTNCYALSFARRHRAMGTRGYQRDGRPETSGPGFGVTLHDWALTEPLRWRTAKHVFLNSMSDAFHPEVPDEYLAALWAVMYWTGADVRGRHAHRPVQTYLILTKRPPRMRAWLKKWADRDTRVDLITRAAERGWCDHEDITNAPFMPGRLASVWLGVSVENQDAADTRIPQLMQTPATVRFVSAEPLLGPLDLTRWLRPAPDCQHAAPDDGCCSHPDNMTPECHRWLHCPVTNGQWQGLDWVIAGGESGPGARPMHPRWPEDLRANCEAAGVPYFYKQWGAWAPHGTGEPSTAGRLGKTIHVDPHGHIHTVKPGDQPPADWARMVRYGKKRSGSALDGEHYQQLPGHYTDPAIPNTLR
ncbi:DUF5131 family protein [Streptomyces chartreusis]|uniref:DUF5131 family protein n=1 Tax=Streptomyces chartreusis TaxID=1969 RepID=UPI00381F674B